MVMTKLATIYPLSGILVKEQKKMKPTRITLAAAQQKSYLGAALKAVKSGALPTVSPDTHPRLHAVVDLDAEAVKTWFAANRRQ